MKYKHALLGLIITLSGWIAYQVYHAGQNDIPPPTTQPVVMNKGKAHGQRLSTPSWSIEYDKVVANADQTVLELDGIHNGIFFKNGKPYLRLQAQHMTVNTISHDFSASGPFHVETVDRKHFRSLDTTEATWNQASKRLLFPTKTRIMTANNTKPLLAGQIRIDTETGDIHIDQIQGRIGSK